MALLESPLQSSTSSLELVTFKAPVTHELGVVAVMGEEINPTLYAQARKLRADVYIDEKGFLEQEARQADGGESDTDDDRSIQLVVTETQVSADNYTRAVIGTSRLIVKRDETDLLPVEQFFPEIPAAQTGSVEASRYIARHSDRAIQKMASVALVMGMANEANSRGAEEVFAVAEEPLEVLFKWLGISVKRLTDPRYVDKYNTKNMAIRFDPKPTLHAIEEKRPTLYRNIMENVSGLY